MARKPDLRQVDQVAREFGMSPDTELGFREYIHECKESGHRGTANDRGDFTMAELRELAREFLGLEDD